MEAVERMKWMQLPRDVLIGHDVLQEIGTICKHLEVGKRAIIVSDSLTRKIAGDAVFEILSDAGYDVNLIEVGGMSRENIESWKNRQPRIKLSSC